MTANDERFALPPGLLNGLLFFAVVVFGSGYIIISKLNDFGAFAVTAVPVLIMIAYGVLLGARLFRLRDDQAGDNLYYMGFLFTLTSLAVSLYQFSAAGSAEQIVQNFGIAIASTIAGITLRILFNQMRRDPVEVEAIARLELAEASRRVRRELESAILEFGYFRRMTQQSIGDALEELKDSIGKARDQLAAEIKGFAASAEMPFDEASRRSEATLVALNERTVLVLEVSKQLVQEGEQLTRNTARIVKAMDALVQRLLSLQDSAQAVDTKLAPVLQNLTQAVNAFGKSTEAQARTIETTLKQTQSAVAMATQLLEDMRITERAR
ncbi:hypothetical protein [Bradyrhizobium sp.]|uniref:hypothetical protein n=1 Tax=Bradyrhizobium sp. TaxID=376 RepID=UPI001ED049B0|nr:hypothetical protein [Bradyrhizobium sp.]MBV8916845.1 hypothetical protein [Bradyrhizobium sp.]MBV9982486.1 hypothetical protein [Bradyrhizobium sp.]